MPVVKDPERNDLTTLQHMVDIKDLTILEIGCGDGRFTWRYADQAASVTAIDPNGEMIATARAHLPRELKGQVSFLETTIEDFIPSYKGQGFDLAIFSWSL
jgi:ubiquinone/menaquinone biosynthesis C-methylase UbiE